MNGFLPDAFALPGFDLDAFVAATLAEDLGLDGRDVTSEAVIPAEAMFDGVMDSRDAVTLAGLPVAVAFFRALQLVVGMATQHPGKHLGKVVINVLGIDKANRQPGRQVVQKGFHRSGPAQRGSQNPHLFGD